VHDTNAASQDTTVTSHDRTATSHDTTAISYDTTTAFHDKTATLGGVHGTCAQSRIAVFAVLGFSLVQGHVDAHHAGAEVPRVFAARSEGGRIA
jgi:hypothetical protein